MSLTRRRLLAEATVAAGIAGTASSKAMAALQPREATNNALGDLRIFGEGALMCEGIAVAANGDVYGAGRDGVLYRVDLHGRVHEAARLPKGTLPSGIALDRKGNVLCCDAGTHAVIRIDQSGGATRFAERVQDVALTNPNCAAFDAEGNLFVTNSTNATDAMAAGEFLRPLGNGSLLRIRRNGRGQVVASGLHFPNGCAIDPREEAIYVLQSSARNCLRIALRKDGTFGKPEIFAGNFPGMPDGIAFAEDGTAFVTVPITMGAQMRLLNQVLKITPDGEWSILVADPACTKLLLPTNCAFGGGGRHDLLVANAQGSHFCRLKTSHIGHKLYNLR